ncbi:MAG: class I SAM-dependent methyltransferase [Candidatus Andersenbacteria bacterium]
MNEGQPRQNAPESEGNLEKIPDLYIELLKQIQEDPASDDVWKKTIELAQTEESSGSGKESYYTKIPLDELTEIGERLRPPNTKEEQYRILAEKSSTGEYWYDIILGHVNDKTFAPVVERLKLVSEMNRSKTIGSGLDVGSGLGNAMRAMAPYFQKVVGVEKSASVASIAAKDAALPKNAEIVSADATNLPFPDNSFAVAVSNGLTHYLTKQEMQQYVAEISRTLKPLGVYFEAFTVKNPDSLLPVTEQEYLTSAKALLVYLIDNLISHNEEEMAWSVRDMVEEFREHGLYYSPPDKEEFEKGIVVAAFVKEK